MKYRMKRPMKLLKTEKCLALGNTYTLLFWRTSGDGLRGAGLFVKCWRLEKLQNFLNASQERFRYLLTLYKNKKFRDVRNVCFHYDDRAKKIEIKLQPIQTVAGNQKSRISSITQILGYISGQINIPLSFNK